MDESEKESSKKKRIQDTEDDELLESEKVAATAQNDRRRSSKRKKQKQKQNLVSGTKSRLGNETRDRPSTSSKLEDKFKVKPQSSKLKEVASMAQKDRRNSSKKKRIKRKKTSDTAKRDSVQPETENRKRESRQEDETKDLSFINSKLEDEFELEPESFEVIEVASMAPKDRRHSSKKRKMTQKNFSDADVLDEMLSESYSVQLETEIHRKESHLEDETNDVLSTSSKLEGELEIEPESFKVIEELSREDVMDKSAVEGNFLELHREATQISQDSQVDLPNLEVEQQSKEEPFSTINITEASVAQHESEVDVPLPAEENSVSSGLKRISTFLTAEMSQLKQESISTNLKRKSTLLEAAEPQLKQEVVTSAKKKKRRKSSNSDSSDDETSKRKKKKKTKKATAEPSYLSDTTKYELPVEKPIEDSSSRVDKVAVAMFILDIIVVAAAVVLFIMKPFCKVQVSDADDKDIDGNLTEINKTSGQPTVQKPPLTNPFQPDNTTVSVVAAGSQPKTPTTSNSFQPDKNTVTDVGAAPPDDSPEETNQIIEPPSLDFLQPGNFRGRDSNNNFAGEKDGTPLSSNQFTLPSTSTTTLWRPEWILSQDKYHFIAEDIIFNKDFNCGVPHVQPNLDRTQGGNRAIRNSWPWLARLQRVSALYSLSICEVTILSPRHVIGACHYIDLKATISDLVISIGDHDSKISSSGIYELAKIRKHPFCKEINNAYYSYKIYDIFLGTVRKEMQFNTEVQPACLPSNKKTLKAAKNCWTYYWDISQPTLQQYHIDVIEESDCQERASHATLTSPSTLTFLRENTAICTQRSDRSTSCPFESGGPLVCKEGGKWIVYGVGSWGFDCRYPAISGVYAALSYSISWICCFMKNIPSCRAVDCDV